MFIDTYEDRKVATFDIPGTYLQTYRHKDKFTLLLLEGKFVDIMCDINPGYKQNGMFKDGRKTFILHILKAINGMIEYDLLFYELYVSVIKDMGFQLKPYDYDMCVANIYINGKRCTIAWYADYNKFSHVEQDVIDDVIVKADK